MKAIGSRLARAVNRVFRRKGPVLADRYHMRVLRTPRAVRNAIAYVLINARKHAKRITRHWKIDPASSGRWFDGWKRNADDLEPERSPPPVARPRFWLTITGWRRRGGGLIDPSEIPTPAS